MLPVVCFSASLLPLFFFQKMSAEKKTTAPFCANSTVFTVFGVRNFLVNSTVSRYLVSVRGFHLLVRFFYSREFSDWWNGKRMVFYGARTVFPFGPFFS